MKQLGLSVVTSLKKGDAVFDKHGEIWVVLQVRNYKVQTYVDCVSGTSDEEKTFWAIELY